MVAKTDEITATVKADDLKTTGHAQISGRQQQTYKGPPDVDLTKQTVGSKVVFRTTQAVALSIETLTSKINLPVGDCVPPCRGQSKQNQNMKTKTKLLHYGLSAVGRRRSTL